MKRTYAGLIASVCAFTVSVIGLSIVEVSGSDSPRGNPTRYCYTIVNDHVWSCYLGPDKPAGLDPIWVGPQSEVRAASVGKS